MSHAKRRKQRQARDAMPVELKPGTLEHVGGGWYLVNGEKIQGKEAAEKAFNANA